MRLPAEQSRAEQSRAEHGARPERTCVRCWRMKRISLCSPSPGSLLSLKITYNETAARCLGNYICAAPPERPSKISGSQAGRHTHQQVLPLRIAFQLHFEEVAKMCAEAGHEGGTRGNGIAVKGGQGRDVGSASVRPHLCRHLAAHLQWRTAGIRCLFLKPATAAVAAAAAVLYLPGRHASSNRCIMQQSFSVPQGVLACRSSSCFWRSRWAA